MKIRKSTASMKKIKSTRRYRDIHHTLKTEIHNKVDDETDYIKENLGIKKTSRNLSNRFYSLLHKEKHTIVKPVKINKIKNRRGNEEITSKRNKNQKFRNSSFFDKIALLFGGVFHWLGQGAFSAKRKTIPRFAILISVIVVTMALGSVALAKAIINEDIVLSDMSITKNPTMNVVVTYGEINVNFETKAMSVAELLTSHDISIGENDIVNPSRDTIITHDMSVIIDRAFNIILYNKGIQTKIITNKGTVATLLENEGIILDEYDKVTPSINEELIPNMEIVYDDVEITKLVEVIPIEYKLEEGYSDTVLVNLYAITQEGKDGKLEKTTEIKIVNGVEEYTKIVNEEIVEESINEIRLWGTASKRVGEEFPEEETNDDESEPIDEYDGIKITNPNQQATNPSIPASPSTFLETVKGHVTAYTHTGSTTATGTMPRSTRTLSNPGSCAVVPSTFPYGSLLYVTGYGYCIAEDTGGFRNDPSRWNQIDLFMNTRDECISFGRRKDVKVYILRKGY